MLSSPWHCCVQERPQLEKERSELLSSIASDIQFLRDLEDKTLELLQKSDGENVGKDSMGIIYSLALADFNDK